MKKVDYILKFKELRKQLELTQKQLAESVGFSRATISQIESGNHKPTVELLTAIVNEYNIDPVFFFLENVIAVKFLYNDNKNRVVRYPVDNPPVRVLEESREKYSLSFYKLEAENSLLEEKIKDLNMQLERAYSQIDEYKEIITMLKDVVKSK